MAQDHRPQLRLAVVALALSLLTAPLTTSAVFAQSASLGFSGAGVFPVHSSMNSQRWFGIDVDPGTNNTLVRLTLSGSVAGGPMNPSLVLYDRASFPGQTGPRPDALDGVARAGLGGTNVAWTIGPFTGYDFPPLPHQDWCMGNFYGGGNSFTFYVYVVDSNQAPITNWYPASFTASYSAEYDDSDVLEWYASPALGVDPLAVTPNQLQPDNDNGAGDSTYTFRVQYANGRGISGGNLPPRWKWARGSAPGDGRTTMVNFDRLPEAAPTDADASLVGSMSINGLTSGDYDWTVWSGDDTWMDRTGDYVAISRNKGVGDGTYPDYEKRTQIEMLLLLDGNIQRPHFMLRENEGDDDFTNGAIYRYVIQPTDFMNFLDNLFQFRYDPPGPDTQDTWTCGIRDTPVSNGYVSLPAGGHTYEFAATDDFFPPRGAAHVQIGWPGNSTRAEFWHPRPPSPYSPTWHTYWEREFEYTREVRPFGYPYDSQDPNNYPNVNPVLSGFPYFDPAVVVSPYLRTNVSVARWMPTGGEPRLVPAIQYEIFNNTTKQFDYADVISPFESIGPQGGPQGTVVGAAPTRPNQPTHYTNDDTIRPNFANIWEEFPPSPGVPFRGGKWTQSTTFTFLVNYWRKPSRSPDFIQCRIRKNNRGGAPSTWRNFTMQQLNPADTDYSDGAVFQFQISADQLPTGGGPGDYNYYFVASDGTRTTTFPNRPPQFTEPESGFTAEDIDVLLPASNPQSDLGVPVDLQGDNDYYWFRVNHPPVLTANDVVPSSDRMGEPFVYYVTYTDVDGEVLNANARGDEPFEASIYIDLFGDPQGESHVAGVSAGTLNYTTQTGTGYAANSLVDAVRPYYVRIDEAANAAALGLTYEITGNSTTQIQATPVPPALGFGADPISAGDRFEILQWFQGKMDRIDPTDNNATDGIRYMFNTANNITLGPGLHRYYFAFRDDWGDWAYPDNPDVSVEGEQIRFPQTLEFVGPEVLENHAPILSNYRFTPDAPAAGPDGTTATGFRLSVTYTDSDNDPPAVIRLGIDGTQSAPDLVLNMTPVNPNDTVYTDGAVFETPAVRLAAGNHVFRAQASDGDLTYPLKASPSDPLLFVGKQTSAGPPPVYNDSEPGPRVAPNTPPTLEFEPNDAPPGQPSPGLDPDAGTQQTVFTYHIIYKDVDVFAGVQGNPPVWVRVFIDGQRTDMQQVDPADTDYTDGALFEATATNLVAGTAHSYYFIGNDGSDNARQPALTAVPNKFPGPEVDEPPGPAKALVVSDVPNDQGGVVQGSFNPSDDDGGGADDVTEYHIYYDTNQNMSAPTLAVTVAAGAGQYPFTWDSAPKTLDLFYMVRAFDGTNESVDSNVAGPVRALDNLAPAPPTNVTATNPGAGTRIDLAWTKSADDGGGANDVTEYRIYRAQTSGGYGTELTTVAAGTTSYQDTTAVDGVDFYYVVRALDGQNESTDSNEAGPVMSTDNSAPTLANFDPMAGARNVAQDTNVAFTATDTGAGVDPTSVQFDVTVAGSAVTGVKSQAAVPNGYRFTFDPAQDFNELDVVQVSVAVSDLAVPNPRTATRTYRFTIVPPPTYAVSGTITEPTTGGGVQGLGGVMVYAGALSAQTDATGQYTIVGLTNGAYEVVPKKRGKSFMPTSRNVTIADTDVPGVDFTAAAGYDIQGHVRDVSGPLANVRVSNGLQEAVTNARGVYALKDSPAGTYVVRPALPGSVFKPSERVVPLPTTAPDGSAVNQDFYAAPETFTVAGRVSTADGGVLSGAKVTVETQGPAPTALGSGKTDISGAYIANKIPAGTYNVRPEKTGFTFEPETLEVTVGPNSINNDFVAFELFTATYPSGLSFLAIPVYPVNDDIVAALGTDRVARWDPTRAGADKYVFAAIEPKSPVLDLAPGRGYFAAFTDATNVEVAGKLVRTADAFSLDLEHGFNMAGNPYPAPLAWSNLAVAAAGPVADYGFLLVPGTRDYELVSDIPQLRAKASIPRGAGFWIESDQATSLTINPPQTASASATSPETPTVDARNWVIPVVAATPVASDLSSRAGIMETSGDGIQANNPPATSGTVDLYFTGDDGRKLACDVRPTTAAKTIEWSFAVWTDLKNTPVSIQLPDLSPVPPEMRVTLVDVDASRTRYARTMQAYIYNSREGGERHFRLIVEPQQGGNLMISAAGAQPTRGGVTLTYTLSRQAAVTISIRNSIGREVATIVRGEDTAAGTNTAVWDLRNAQGTRVPSGTYLIVLQAASDDGQQMQALKSVTVNR